MQCEIIRVFFERVPIQHYPLTPPQKTPLVKIYFYCSFHKFTGLRSLFEKDLKILRFLAMLADFLDPSLDGTDRDWQGVYTENSRLLYREVRGRSIQRRERKTKKKSTLEIWPEKTLTHATFRLFFSPNFYYYYYKTRSTTSWKRATASCSRTTSRGSLGSRSPTSNGSACRPRCSPWSTFRASK